MRGKILGLLAATALAMPMAADAATKIQTGGSNGLSFTAQRSIIGVGSTATNAGGGNPIYQPTLTQQKGVVSLIMNTAGGSFVCSGTLLPDRISVLTAAHCVSDGAGTANPISTTAYFNNTGSGDTVPYSPLAGPNVSSVSVARYFVNSAYTGDVVDQNDIAVLRLADYAPSWATTFAPDFSGDLTGVQFNVAGYGRRSDTGGTVGANLGPGRLRQGLNDFDFALGNSVFGGFFTDPASAGDKFFGTADVAFSYLSDFDNGLAANDAACLLAGAFTVATLRFCDVGSGLREVGVAGGDSGGPQFAGGKIVSVTSYGLSFGPAFGDVGGGLNSSFGEFSGYVPTFIHEKFIRAALAVPEPATWLQMIFGFGLIGSILRRRQAAKIAVA